MSTINYGYTEKASSEPIGPRFLRITDIQNDHVDWDSVPYCKIVSNELPKFRLDSGDIVFARTGATTGKSFLVDEPPDAVFASYLIRLRLREKTLLPKFVSLFFQTNRYWKSIRDGVAGSAQGGFNASKLSALKIPVPPLPEQKRIVGILDEAFAGIETAKANAETNLQNARALFNSHLNTVFTQKGKGWVEKPLIMDNRFIDYRGRTPKKTDSGLRLITAKNVRMGFLQTQPEEFVSPESYESWMTRGIPQKGDVLFTTEAPLGFVCQLDTDEKVVFAQRIITFQTDRRVINPTYLKWALMSPLVQSRIHDSATGATAQGIKASLLKKIMIHRPSMPEQDSIVKQLDSLSAETQLLESIYQQKLDALDTLKKSLLHQAFTGEL